MIIPNKTCCFIGHRQIDVTDKLIIVLKRIIERNCEMINNSCFCVIYLNEGYTPSIKKGLQPKSGTKLAYDYAKTKEINIVNVFGGTGELFPYLN